MGGDQRAGFGVAAGDHQGMRQAGRGVELVTPAIREFFACFQGVCQGFRRPGGMAAALFPPIDFDPRRDLVEGQLLTDVDEGVDLLAGPGDIPG